MTSKQGREEVMLSSDDVNSSISLGSFFFEMDQAMIGEPGRKWPMARIYFGNLFEGNAGASKSLRLNVQVEPSPYLVFGQVLYLIIA
jgi:hypothetical protein